MEVNLPPGCRPPRPRPLTGQPGSAQGLHPPPLPPRLQAYLVPSHKGSPAPRSVPALPGELFLSPPGSPEFQCPQAQAFGDPDLRPMKPPGFVQAPASGAQEQLPWPAAAGFKVTMATQPCSPRRASQPPQRGRGQPNAEKGSGDRTVKLDQRGLLDKETPDKEPPRQRPLRRRSRRKPQALAAANGLELSSPC